MKIITTSTETSELSVSPQGKTVGSHIDEMIADCLQASSVDGLHTAAINRVTVEISDTEWAALKMLRAPVRDETPEQRQRRERMERAATSKPSFPVRDQ